MKNQRITKKKKTAPNVRVQTKQAEVSAVGKLLRQIGGLGGGAMGAYLGQPVAGSAAGNSLGAAISKWLGFGDYTVGTNSIVQKASTGIPMMHKEGQSVTIRHREFIATVESSIGFAVQRSFRLNPGDRDTFPWLATIANSFQEYKFKGIVFHYIPTSGNAISGTSPSLGAVMMQTSYRANDTPPINKSELLNEYWSGEVVPSETLAHPIEYNPAENPFNVQYVRRGELPSGDNQLFYDLGVTHLCTQGQLAAGNALGDIWVTYEVELKKPIVASNVTSNASDYVGFATLPTIATPFGGLLKQSGSLLVQTTLTGFRVTGAGYTTHLITITLSGTSIGGAWGTAALTNCVQTDFNTSRSVWQISTASQAINIFAVTPVDATKPFSVSWPGLALTGALANSAINITEL